MVVFSPHALQGINITSVQGSWQLQDTTVFNFLLVRRTTPIRTLGNILFFQDPTLPTRARSFQGQAGALINYTNVDEIQAVALILPNGQPRTGNLYLSRDTHVLGASFFY